MTLTYSEKIIRKGLVKITRNKNENGNFVDCSGDVDIIEEYPVAVCNDDHNMNERPVSGPPLTRHRSTSSNKSLDIENDKKKFIGGIFSSINEKKIRLMGIVRIILRN